MIRTFFIDLALFLLPFALYWLYLQVERKSEEDAAAGRAHPWVSLFCAGLVLAIGGLITLGLSASQPSTTDAYHPHWKAPKLTSHDD